MGIPLLDHVIIGAEGITSFRAEHPDMFGCEEEVLSLEEEQLYLEADLIEQ